MNTISPSIRTAQQRTPSSLAFLDLSNIFIAGAQLSAVRVGLAPSIEVAMAQKIADPAFRINFRALHTYVIGTDTNSCGFLSGSNAMGQDLSSTWTAARRAGWDATATFTRTQGGREKRVDTTISLMMVEHTVLKGLCPQSTELTLLGGDQDYLPAVEMLNRYGFTVDVVGWNHSTSADLRHAARHFIALDPYFNQLFFRQPT